MALVISRKPGEDVLIGPDVRVGIVKVKEGNSVCLAITAPKMTTIIRAELADAVDGEAPAELLNGAAG